MLRFVRFDPTRYRFHLVMEDAGSVRRVHVSLNGIVDLFGMMDYDRTDEVEAIFRRGHDVLCDLVAFVLATLPGDIPDPLPIGRGMVMAFRQRQTRHVQNSGVDVASQAID